MDDVRGHLNRLDHNLVECAALALLLAVAEFHGKVANTLLGTDRVESFAGLNRRPAEFNQAESIIFCHVANVRVAENADWGNACAIGTVSPLVHGALGA